MADTTGRIPLWIIGTVTGIVVIGLLGHTSLASAKFEQKLYFH